MQTLIVFGIIAAAVAYAAVIVARRVRSFTPTEKCSDDCGCSASSGKKA